MYRISRSSAAGRHAFDLVICNESQVMILEESEPAQMR